MRKAKTGNGSERLLWLAYALLGMTIIDSALVTWGNVPRMSAWLLALLALGIGQALLLPTAAGSFGGLLVAAAWVLLRQAAGTWQPDAVPQSVLELAGLSSAAVLAIWLRRTWWREREQLLSLQTLQDLVGQHEAVSGLVSREVAEMRLAIEIDRARSFGGSLGLALFEATPRRGSALSETELQEAYRAIARQLGSEVEAYDTPFADKVNRTGVILPERSASELARQGAAVCQSLANAVFLDRQGSAQAVQQGVRLDCGLSLYQGEAVPALDLVQAAEECLRLSRAQPEGSPLCCVDIDGEPIVEGQSVGPVSEEAR